MSRIYSFLLRVYPRRFQQRYGAEALLLFEDRLRAEKGLLRRLRLWADLLSDLVTGLSLAYGNTYATAASASAAQTLQAVSGFPAFRTLDEEPLKASSVAMGGLMAMAALGLFIFGMSHAAGLRRFAGSVGRLNAAAAGSARNPGVAATAEQLEEKVRSDSQLAACSFEKLEEHPGNIGYVKLTWFANPANCRTVAAAVMEHLNDTDAVIFDLRDARGGYPEMVRWMAGWLFAKPVAWYNPRAESASESVTSPIAGSRLADKPVFILTSRDTFSGAEHFAYNLKMLKRATIVGETTSGAAHAGVKPGDPAGAKPAWEGVGVVPDVRVRSGDALRVAEKLALSAVGKK